MMTGTPSSPRRRLRLGGSGVLKGAALVMALVEAIAAQAKPDAGIRLNPKNTPVPGGDAYDTGRGLLAAGDVTGAMAAFRQALVEAPQSVDTLNAIAVCYDKLGRYDVSRGYYDAALALAPGSVQVLNNLGYSLYLQGELRGAIPYLQQAAAAGDPQAAATSRRLLQLISVKLRESEARASMAAAVAELKAPAARIELAANGEQRLVLAAPKVRPEVAATLGDAAALTVVPKVWTARDERRVVAEDAAQERAETAAVLAEVAGLTAADTALREANPANIGSAEAAASITAGFPIAAQPQAPVVVTAPVVKAAAIAFTPEALAPPIAPAPASASGRKRGKATAAPARMTAKAPAAPAAATALATAAGEARALAGRLVANSFGYASAVLEAPAWIVSARRDAAPAPAPRIVGQSPDASGSIGGFDSDDPVLNAFAARMRRSANDNGAAAIAPEVAISRLEALIARLRRA